MNKTIKNSIKKLVKELATRIKPQKIVLFGSHAYGNPNKNSDLDFLIVLNTKLSGLKRYCWVRENMNSTLPMDVLVKTPAEVNKRVKMGDPFYKEILSKGKTLYESTQKRAG